MLGHKYDEVHDCDPIEIYDKLLMNDENKLQQYMLIQYYGIIDAKIDLLYTTLECSTENIKDLYLA